MDWATENFSSARSPQFWDSFFADSLDTNDEQSVPGLAENQVEDSFAIVPVPTKRRKSASKAWETFTKVKDADGTESAICKHCRKKYAQSSKTGTSNLLKHMEKCPNKRNGDGERASEMSGSSAPFLNKEKNVFDQERSWMNIARMIIKHRYPLSVVVKDSSENFEKNLQPTLELQSRGSLKADILHIYKEEKEKLHHSLNKRSSGNINLTVNIWRFGAPPVYCCLTVQYIDGNWELKKKVIAFRRKEFCNGYWELYGTFKSMLLDWNIGKNLLSVTAENSEESDKIVTEIENWLAYNNSLSFYGELVHVNCFLHALNLLVEDGLQKARCLLCKIMNCISYVRGTPEKDCNFRKAVHYMRSQGKKVTSEDMPVSWDFNFQMLEGMLELKETFNLLAITDQDFYRLNPEKEEWDKLTLIYQCLKVLDESSQSLLATRCLAANVYFPKVCNIYWNLIQWKKGVNSDVCLMANKMTEKFDKYWRNWSVVLAISVVLDPRFKFDIVECWYKEIYNDDAAEHCRRISDTLTGVYNKYVNENSTTSSYVIDHHHMLDSLGMPCISSHDADDGKSHKTELARYLEEPKFPRVENFDILGWWRINTPIFPTLAKMARDFLAIPVSAAQSNPSFNEDIMKIVLASPELDSEIIEALICAKDWS